MNYLNKLTVILLATTIIPMQAQKNKENFSQYFIKAFTTDQQVIEATVTFYKEDRENPTVLDMFSKDEIFTYTGGKVKVFVMTYQDTLNHHYEMVSDEVRSLFYILRKRLEQQGIKTTDAVTHHARSSEMNTLIKIFSQTKDSCQRPNLQAPPAKDTKNQ